MPPETAKTTGDAVAEDGTRRIRSVLENRGDKLCSTIASKIWKANGPLGHPELYEQACEVMHEAAVRALARPERLDPGRSAYGWLVGIAAKILLERSREAGRVRRVMSRTDLGDAAWAFLLDRKSFEAEGDKTGAWAEVREAITRLNPRARLALECQYFRGLTGKALAEALGGTTEVAARTRVHRAVRQLRDLIRLDDAEVTS